MSRVEVLRDGDPVLDLDVIDGTVTLDANASFRGRVDVRVAIPRDLIPRADGDLLTPYGDEIRVSRGVTFPEGGEELVALGVFPIEELTLNDSGTSWSVTITGNDRASRIADARLETPYNIPAGTNYVTAIRDLLDGAAPGRYEYAFPPTSRVTPLIAFEEGDDRWQRAQEMAESIGMALFFNGDGVCTMRPESDPALDPVAEIVDGHNGVLISATRDWTRAQIYNRVIATGDNADLPAPVIGIATDDNPESPTYYYGRFGRKPRFYQSQFIMSVSQALDAARGILSRSTGKSKRVSFGAVANPALEPGDVIVVRRESIGLGREAHVLDEVKINLASGAMTGSSRMLAALGDEPSNPGGTGGPSLPPPDPVPAPPPPPTAPDDIAGSDWAENEDTSPAWTLWASPYDEATVTNSTDDKVGGAKSLKVVATATDDFNEIWLTSPVFDVEQTPYDIGIWARTAAGSHWVIVGVDWLDASSVLIPGHEFSLVAQRNATATWSRFDATGLVPPPGAVKARMKLVCIPTATGQTWYFDTAAFVRQVEVDPEVPAVPELTVPERIAGPFTVDTTAVDSYTTSSFAVTAGDLIVACVESQHAGSAATNILDSTFADNEGDTPAWVAASGYAASTRSNSTDFAATGTKSFKAVATAAAQIGVEMPYASRQAVSDAVTYTISAKVRGSVGRWVNVVVNWYNASGTYLSWQHVGYGNVSTTGFSTYSASLTPPSGATAVQIRVLFDANAIGQTMYVDDVRIEQPGGNAGDAVGTTGLTNTHAGSWSWTQVTETFHPASPFRQRISVFTALAPTTGPGTITFTFSNPRNIVLVPGIYRIRNADQSAPVRQSATASVGASANQVTATFATEPLADSLIFAFGANSYDTVPPTLEAGSGFTELHTLNSTAPADNVGVLTAYDLYGLAADAPSATGTAYGAAVAAVEVRRTTDATIPPPPPPPEPDPDPEPPPPPAAKPWLSEAQMAQITGPRAGVTLTPHSGDLTLSTPGQVVTGVAVTGAIRITAANVTVRDFTCYGVLNSPGVTGTLLEYGRISPPAGYTGLCEGIAFSGYTARYIEIRNFFDGAKAHGNCTFEWCWIHDLAGQAGCGNTGGGTPHCDGIQQSSGSGLTVRFSRFERIVSNSAIYVRAEGSNVTSNLTVEDCYLGSCGNWTIWIQPNIATNHQGYSRVRRCRFGPPSSFYGWSRPTWGGFLGLTGQAAQTFGSDGWQDNEEELSNGTLVPLPFVHRANTPQRTVMLFGAG